ncbi:MAG TPA: hypothetical protein PKW08_02860 [Flavobacteriaceae bacterium]|nr:hypothetical protein [Flavobacteriaceae bacterium]HPF11344.1 hypothetical protein [Flavobacteriaceae bacterium]HQU20507.1 hypothetical protein [Flavobacteriaceae bacterium]HQU65860.1 hypothetical protein [Flavobacteriaceae bacterium]HRW44158.1 hypothetical protein [Flavobacteriaceae bacterium]
MNLKWSLLSFLAILAFMGIRLENTIVPNQEIVVQFGANTTNADEAQKVLTAVKYRLQSIGAKEIEVSEMQDGKLKITYFSAIDIAFVNEVLSHGAKDGISFLEGKGLPKPPCSDPSLVFEFKVSKIKNEGDNHLGHQGVLVDVKSTCDPHHNSVWFFKDAKNDFPLLHHTSFATCFTSKVALFIDTTSHIIPEVRAGPLS